jgi:hypothetical protein
MISLANEMPWLLAPATFIASMLVISLMVWVLRVAGPAFRAFTLIAVLAMSLFLTVLFIF